MNGVARAVDGTVGVCVQLMAEEAGIRSTINRENRRVVWGTVVLLTLLLIGFIGLTYYIQVVADDVPVGRWLLTTIPLVVGLLGTTTLIVFVVYQLNTTASRRVYDAIASETERLRVANNRAKALQAMASTLRATLDFEPVVESALDVCGLVLSEAGVPRRAVMGAVFLYQGERLEPITYRRFSRSDLQRPLSDSEGIVATALKQAETILTSSPQKDPVLSRLTSMENCQLAVCIPLRAGYQIFGAILLGVTAKVRLRPDQIDLFNSVADQAVIALQNAQLYQRLEAEKQRIIETEEEARKSLARDLHDGPTQSVAAIVMRINFVSSLLRKDPRAALDELRQIEKLAKETSREIRGMLFTLRPLVLDSEGLAAAIEKVMERTRETSGSEVRLVGGEHGELLDEKAQGIVFFIVEEALGNASKHAEASLIEVRMWREDDLFVVRIQDNGKGFDFRRVTNNYNSRGSLGMLNMKERADLINGTLKVSSRPGEGTAITLIVPLVDAGRNLASLQARR